MKLTTSLLIFLSIFSEMAFAGKLVLDGKVYSLQEEKKDVCGELDGPEYQAAKVVISVAQNLGVANAKAACEVDPKFCDPKVQKQMGLDMLFMTIRRYPSTFSSEACKQLRAECQKRCETANLLDGQSCLIECSQYETYNK